MLSKISKKTAKGLAALAITTGLVGILASPSKSETKDVFVSEQYLIDVDSPRKYLGPLPKVGVTIEIEGETQPNWYEFIFSFYTDGWDKKKNRINDFYNIDVQSYLDLVYPKPMDIPADVRQRSQVLDVVTKKGLSGQMKQLYPLKDAPFAKATIDIGNFLVDRGEEVLLWSFGGPLLPGAATLTRKQGLEKIVQFIIDTENIPRRDVLMLLEQDNEIANIKWNVVDELGAKITPATQIYVPFIFRSEKEKKFWALINLTIKRETLVSNSDQGVVRNAVFEIDLNKPLKQITYDDVKNYILQEKADRISKIYSAERNFGEGELDALKISSSNIDNSPRKERIALAVREERRIEKGFDENFYIPHWSYDFYIFPGVGKEVGPILKDSVDCVTINKIEGSIPMPKSIDVLVGDFNDDWNNDILVSYEGFYFGEGDNYNTFQFFNLYLNERDRFKRIQVGEWDLLTYAPKIGGKKWKMLVNGMKEKNIEKIKKAIKEEMSSKAGNPEEYKIIYKKKI
ncbi:hypothetical protein COS75_01980 [Candidatus Pacearchaeota archaeon CG06_land_8_20_14_3_00_35_12]|nr:MAG: hypothetical protein COS75_01980 [Candidatus Pacearchaeota archaeon CG06_land_8_20_14_3_00_35_12]